MPIKKRNLKRLVNADLKKFEVGDKVQLDDGNATIYQAVHHGVSSGVVQRLEDGSAVVEWKSGMHTLTPFRYLRRK